MVKGKSIDYLLENPMPNLEYSKFDCNFEEM